MTELEREGLAAKAEVASFLAMLTPLFISIKNAITHKEVDLAHKKFKTILKKFKTSFSFSFQKTMGKVFLESEAEARKIIEKNLSKRSAAVFSSGISKKALTSLKKLSITDLTKSFNNYENSVAAFVARAKVSLREKEALSQIFSEELFNKRFSKDVAKKRVMDSLAESVSAGRITAGKRIIPLDRYAEMLVMTVGQAAHSRAVEAVSLKNGITRVRISAHNSKDWCIFYEGKVFSLVNNDPLGYPHISELPNGGTPFHPNCLHFEIPFYIEDTSEEQPADQYPNPELLSRDTKKLRKAFSEIEDV